MSALRPCYECDGLGLFVCAQCEHSTYCSVACQRVDWLRSHATVCRAPAAAADPLERAPVSSAIHARMEALATALAAQRGAFLQALGSGTLVPSPLGVDLEDLPPEVFALIARDLATDDIRVLMATTTAWRDLYGPRVWRFVLRRDFTWLRTPTWDGLRHTLKMPPSYVAIHPQLTALLEEEAAIDWQTIRPDDAFNLYERVLQSTARAMARDLANVWLFLYHDWQHVRVVPLAIRIVSARYTEASPNGDRPLTICRLFFDDVPEFRAKKWLHENAPRGAHRDFYVRVNRVNRALGVINAVLARREKATFEELFSAIREFVLFILVSVDSAAMLEYSPVPSGIMEGPQPNQKAYADFTRAFQSAHPDRDLTQGGGALLLYFDPVYKGLPTGNVRMNTFH